MKRELIRAKLFAMAALILLPGVIITLEQASYGGDDPPGQSIADQLGLPTFAGPGGKAVKVSAIFSVAPGKGLGQLRVTAKVAPQNHMYSVTQKPGGPLPTKISVTSSAKVKLSGPWVPDKKPTIKASDIFDVPIEEHHGTVTWTAPFEVSAGVAAKALKIQVKLSGQVCTDDLASCTQVNENVTAKYQVSEKPPGQSEPVTAVDPESVGDAPSDVVAQAENSFGATPAAFQDEFRHITIEGEATPKVVTAGATVSMSFKLTPAPTYHVYDHARQDSGGPFKPTLLVAKVPEGWQVSGPETDGIPVATEDVDGNPLIYYEEPVTWILSVKVPEGTPVGTYQLTGGVGYQLCTESFCDPPGGVNYRVPIIVAAESRAGSVALVMQTGKYSEVANQSLASATSAPVKGSESGTETDSGTGESVAEAGFLDQLNVKGGADDLSLVTVLMIAFAAGFILNFMPCVLPVIGLKIVSFVQQAGESRQRIFMLNLWFSIGLISVFLILATLAKLPAVGLGWGDQFRNLPFNITLTAVVFVFALSFLGVWEIPIPGFVASGKTAEVAEQEGPAGAFCKGVLTTVLATPCSGPLLVPALTWAVSQKLLITYLGFFCVGLGMAFPYLVIGANPQLIRFLPKPGAWMETFKNIMGFVLLATVVFLMTIISSIEIPMVLPVFTFLIGLWAACWWIGRTPLTAEFSQQARAWCGGLVVVACTGWIAFGLMDGMMSARYEGQAVRDVKQFKKVAMERAKEKRTDDHELDWRPYSVSLLEELTRQGKSVFIDFTADW